MQQLLKACHIGGLRALYRHVYWWRDDRIRLRPLSGIRTVVAYGESLGDNLLCTNVLAGLHAAGRGPLAMLTPYPELFAHLPFSLRCLPFDPATIAALSRRGPSLILPTYGRYQATIDRHVPIPQHHLITELCRSAGLQGEVELKPLLVLTEAERRAAATPGQGMILVQPSNRAARMPAGNKDWPFERWQQTVAALQSSHRVGQIGAASDPLLEGVQDLRGQLTFRELAALLAGAELFAGGEGFLMHLARAVDCPAVIVLGGRTAPHQTCYRENTNLFTALPCAPCWQMNTCDFERKCLTQISVADVLGAIGIQLERPRPTKVERVTI